MDEFNVYSTEEIVFCKPTQVGGTEIILNTVGYIIHEDPAPTMLVYPSDDLALSVKKKRLEPMLEACPELAKRYL